MVQAFLSFPGLASDDIKCELLDTVEKLKQVWVLANYWESTFQREGVLLSPGPLAGYVPHGKEDRSLCYSVRRGTLQLRSTCGLGS